MIDWKLEYIKQLANNEYCLAAQPCPFRNKSVPNMEDVSVYPMLKMEVYTYC